jgi:ABC-type transport system substrate-binding protein
MAEAIQKDWEKLGIQVELVAMPYDQLASGYLEPPSTPGISMASLQTRPLSLLEPDLQTKDGQNTPKDDCT